MFKKCFNIILYCNVCLTLYKQSHFQKAVYILIHLYIFFNTFFFFAHKFLVVSLYIFLFFIFILTIKGLIVVFCIRHVF